MDFATFRMYRSHNKTVRLSDTRKHLYIRLNVKDIDILCELICTGNNTESVLSKHELILQFDNVVHLTFISLYTNRSLHLTLHSEELDKFVSEMQSMWNDKNKYGKSPKSMTRMKKND